jgi:hypothetical protein
MVPALDVLRGEPLLHYFPIDESCLDKDLSCLFLQNTKFNNSSVLRIVNALRRSGYNTLGDVLHSTGYELKYVKSLGLILNRVLFDLLKEILENPESIMNYTIIPTIGELKTNLLNASIESRNINGFTRQLHHYFPIPEHYLNMDIDISCLIGVLRNRDSKQNVTRIINSLRSAGYGKLNDVLHATGVKIYLVNRLGAKCHMLLFDLLNRISESPECVLDYRVYSRKKEEINPIPSPSPEPPINLKKDRILARLREMGMIV